MSDQFKRNNNMCVLEIKTVQSTNVTVVVVSIAVIRNVSLSEWLKKVIIYCNNIIYPYSSVVRHGVMQGKRGRMSSKTRPTLTMNDQPQSPPLPILTVITKLYNDTRPQNPARPIAPRSEPISAHEMLQILEYDMGELLHFLERIPDFAEINEEDKSTMLHRNFFPLFALKQCHREVEVALIDAFLFENNIVVTMSDLPKEFVPLFSMIRQEFQPFQKTIEWDAPSFATSLVLQYFGPEEDQMTLRDHGTIQRIHSTVVNALKDHCCTANSPNDPKLSKIIALVSFSP